jgi:hypothetical protein
MNYHLLSVLSKSKNKAFFVVESLARTVFVIARPLHSPEEPLDSDTIALP